MQITRIFDLLDQNYEKFSPEAPVVAGKKDGKWDQYNTQQYKDTVDKLSKGLLELGVRKNDKIATIIHNSPQWNFFDMGLMQIGAIQIPIYPTISEANYSYILNEANVKFVIVSDQQIYERIKHIVAQISSIQDIYSIEKIKGIKHWEEIHEKGKSHQGDIEEIKAGIDTTDIATIIYTSGTTGNPKGVMLSHSNFIHNFQAASNILSVNPLSRALSFLPLCHVYERMINYMYLNMGVSCYYCDSIDRLRDFMKEVSPEIFGAVPRVIEKTYDKLVRTGRGLKGLKKQLFFWALHLAHRFEFDGKNGFFYNIQLKIADKLVYSKWRLAFGGKLDTIISGGATLNPRLARTFWAANIKIMEGYGLTETSPVIAVSTFDKGGAMFGTVGPVMENVEVSFSDDGEILTKGPCLMKGYYLQPKHTKEVIDADGWLHTGDIGAMIDGRYLKITDRKKEIFKTSGGKYIAPQVVENKFKESPFIENVIVVGENRQYTTAIVLPNFEHIESWCEVKKHPWDSPKEAIEDARIIARIQREIDESNQSLDRVEQVKKFELIAEAWTIENGELSPTLKLRRKSILDKHQDLVEKMYA